MSLIRRARNVHQQGGWRAVVNAALDFSLNHVGGAIDRIRYSRTGFHAARDPIKDVGKLVNKQRPTIIVGGAYHGSEIPHFQKLFPESEIHAFEPLPSAASFLRDSFRDVTVHELALGSQNGVEVLYKAENDFASSIFQPQAHQGTGADPVEEIEVEVVRLDSVVDGVDILKLDVQGYELQALKGAGELMHGIEVVWSELQFAELYEGADLYYDVDDFLRSFEFGLFQYYDLYTDAEGRLHWGDALYVKN